MSPATDAERSSADGTDTSPATCDRCGSFVAPEKRKARLDGLRICPVCWEKYGRLPLGIGPRVWWRVLRRPAALFSSSEPGRAGLLDPPLALFLLILGLFSASAPSAVSASFQSFGRAIPASLAFEARFLEVPSSQALFWWAGAFALLFGIDALGFASPFGRETGFRGTFRTTTLCLLPYALTPFTVASLLVALEYASVERPPLWRTAWVCAVVANLALAIPLFWSLVLRWLAARHLYRLRPWRSFLAAAVSPLALLLLTVAFAQRFSPALRQ